MNPKPESETVAGYLDRIRMYSSAEYATRCWAAKVSDRHDGVFDPYLIGNATFEECAMEAFDRLIERVSEAEDETELAKDEVDRMEAQNDDREQELEHKISRLELELESLRKSRG